MQSHYNYFHYHLRNANTKSICERAINVFEERKKNYFDSQFDRFVRAKNNLIRFGALFIFTVTTLKSNS